MKNTNNKGCGPKRVIIPVLSVIFFIAFSFCGWKFFSILLANRQADKAYSDFRDFALQEAAKSVSLMDGPVVAQPGASKPGLGDTETTKPSEAKQVEESAESTAALPPKSRTFSVNIKGLQQFYPELSAWLRSDATGIDYPVMHGKDNEYYLTRLYDGTYNVNGSIFVDYRNTGVLTDDNTVIYGHNMKNHGMFNPLNEYKSQSFYDDNPTMMLCTSEGDLTVDLICGTVEDGNDEFVQFDFDNFEEMCSYVDRLKARSTFKCDVVLQPGDRLVSLCTCTYETFNARYMLVGRVSGSSAEA